MEYWRAELGGRTFVEHTIEKVAAGLVDPRMAEKTVGQLLIPRGRVKARAARVKA